MREGDWISIRAIIQKWLFWAEKCQLKGSSWMDCQPHEAACDLYLAIEQIWTLTPKGTILNGNQCHCSDTCWLAKGVLSCCWGWILWAPSITAQNQVDIGSCCFLLFFSKIKLLVNCNVCHSFNDWDQTISAQVIQCFLCILQFPSVLFCTSIVSFCTEISFFPDIQRSILSLTCSSCCYFFPSIIFSPLQHLFGGKNWPGSTNCCGKVDL